MKKAIVIGCGLSGAVIARELAEYGYSVEIMEKRNHVAGNLYDYIDEHGILVHKYGPHTFHSTKKELFDYVSKYEDWKEYKLTCGAVINNKCTPTPFNFKTIDDFFDKNKAADIKNHLKTYYKDQKTVSILELLNHKDPVIQEYAQFLFDNDYSLYTAKQWGISTDKVDPSILKRVPVRLDYKEGYFDDAYQAMPKHSYVKFFENLLNHSNIKVSLNTDALKLISIENNNLLYKCRKVNFPIIYTGAIDKLFGFKYGALPYRSLRFIWKYEDIDSKQDMPVVAYPQAKGYTRITEYKKLPFQPTEGTSYAVEYPLMCDGNSELEPYYPLLTSDNISKYEMYKNDADNISHLTLCGRLACFKYFNMDQALENALICSKKVID